MTALNAYERSENPKKVRRMGYIPGSIYGPGISRSLSVQFEEKELRRFLKNHSIGAKTRLKVNGNELQCVVKDIQFDHLGSNIIHVEFYASSEDKLVRVKLPLKFKGKEALLKNNLVLSILQDDIEVQGVLKDLPEFVEVDVSNMKDGSRLTMEDIPLPDGIKLESQKDDVVARISAAVMEEDIAS